MSEIQRYMLMWYVHHLYLHDIVQVLYLRLVGIGRYLYDLLNNIHFLY